MSTLLALGVPVRVLNQQIKRNRDRFPSDFVFQLKAKEHEILRSQIVISRDTHGGRRYTPYAFTEHGAIMAATVLNSDRAVQMSVFVVRAFVRLREMLATNRRLAGKIDELENRLDTSDSLILDILATIKEMMIPKRRRGARIGFQLPPGKHQYPEPSLEASAPKLRRAERAVLQSLRDPTEPTILPSVSGAPQQAHARLGHAVP